jgi:hypothetical protein
MTAKRITVTLTEREATALVSAIGWVEAGAVEWWETQTRHGLAAFARAAEKIRRAP